MGALLPADKVQKVEFQHIPLTGAKVNKYQLHNQAIFKQVWKSMGS